MIRQIWQVLFRTGDFDYVVAAFDDEQTAAEWRDALARDGDSSANSSGTYEVAPLHFVESGTKPFTQTIYFQDVDLCGDETRTKGVERKTEYPVEARQPVPERAEISFVVAPPYGPARVRFEVVGPTAESVAALVSVHLGVSRQHGIEAAIKSLNEATEQQEKR